MKSLVFQVWLPAVLLLVAGCAVNSDEERLQDHCFYVSPSKGKEYCGTTMIEIISHPEIFDGRLVTIRGWVIREGDTIMLFPFSEYAERGFANSAIIASGDAIDTLRQSLPASSAHAVPQRVTMSGRFTSLRGKQTSSDVPRLGVLEGVVSVMP